MLIDMNEHFFEMVPRMQIHPSQIDTLLVTHPHRDHFTPVLLTQRPCQRNAWGMVCGADACVYQPLLYMVAGDAYLR